MMMTPFFHGVSHVLTGGGLQPVSSGLWAWHDAADAATISLADSTRVTAWNDKSGNGRHTHASGTARPYSGTRSFNGTNVLDFDSAQALTFASSANPAESGDCTILVVGKNDLVSTAGALYHGSRPDSNNEAAGVWLMANVTSGEARIGTCCNVNAATQSRVGSSGSTDAAIFGLVRNGSNQYAVYNEETGDNANASHATPVGPALYGRRHHTGQGGANWLDGFIAEVLMYDRALTAGEMTQNLAYLQAKWWP